MNEKSKVGKARVGAGKTYKGGKRNANTKRSYK